MIFNRPPEKQKKDNLKEDKEYLLNYLENGFWCRILS